MRGRCFVIGVTCSSTSRLIGSLRNRRLSRVQPELELLITLGGFIFLIIPLFTFLNNINKIKIRHSFYVTHCPLNEVMDVFFPLSV